MQNKEKPPNNEGPSLFLSCSTLSKNHHARTSFFFTITPFFLSVRRSYATNTL